MTSVRKGVFETNSSSSHSISIARNKTGVYDYKVPMDEQGRVPIIFGMESDFGWGLTTYNDLYTKLNYMITLILEIYIEDKLVRQLYRTLPTKPEDILKLKEIKKVEEVCKKKIKGFRGFKIGGMVYGRKYTTDDVLYYHNGYCYPAEGIDHDSYERWTDAFQFLSCYKVTLENFLFNPSVKLEITNDNI